MKRRIIEIVSAFKDEFWYCLFVFIIASVIAIVSFYIGHQGGWYCEYCHEGSIRGKFEVEHTYGNTPCKCSEDSCHHFVLYFQKPVAKPKYTK